METIALIALIVLGVCFITNSIFLYNFYSKNVELNKKLLKLSNTKKDSDLKLSDIQKMYENKYKKLLEIKPGSLVIFTHSLITIDTKVSFEVLYEAEVLQCTKKMVKVKATTFTSNDAFGRDAVNKNNILAFMDSKWIDINTVDTIIDESTRRDIKLDIIGV